MNFRLWHDPALDRISLFLTQFDIIKRHVILFNYEETWKKLDRKFILRALTRLGELAEEQGLKLELCIYGGVAMMLAYDSRTITKDVDAVVRPSREGMRLAHIDQYYPDDVIPPADAVLIETIIQEVRDEQA